MISDEKLKQNLFLAYKICELYLVSGATVSELNSETGVSLATIKRSLHMIESRLDDYLRLLPGLGTEEELTKFQDRINKAIIDKKNYSRGHMPISFSKYSEEVEDIKTLYSVNDPYVTDEAKSYVFDLRDNGASIREIHNATGLSLAAIHDIVCKESGKKK